MIGLTYIFEPEGFFGELPKIRYEEANTMILILVILAIVQYIVARRISKKIFSLVIILAIGILYAVGLITENYEIPLLYILPRFGEIYLMLTAIGFVRRNKKKCIENEKVHKDGENKLSKLSLVGKILVGVMIAIFVTAAILIFMEMRFFKREYEEYIKTLVMVLNWIVTVSLAVILTCKTKLKSEDKQYGA